jgi:hypothetical protein
MDVANRLGRQIYFNDVIIKHEHPANNLLIRSDSTYQVNDKYWDEDKKTYELRKCKDYDVSVLVCTIPQRSDMFIQLINYINKLKQTTTLKIEVLYDSRVAASIGEKRNSLLQSCNGTYCCYIDDDDKITEDYFKVIEESQLKYDCIALNGIMFEDGKEKKPFYHSLKYNKWFEDEKGYYRNPNHLNPIKTSIAKQFRFPDENNGEDYNFSRELLKSGLLKTEYVHNKTQYIYMYINNKPVRL